MIIPAEGFYATLERSTDEVDPTNLSVRVGTSMRCNEYCTLCLPLDQHGALRTRARSARYALRHMLYVIHRPGERHLGMRLSDETRLVATDAVAQQVIPTLVTPLEIRVHHAEPNAALSHKGRFACDAPLDDGA